MFRITFWGVRGSIPTPGPDTAQTGGNTSCVEVQAGDTHIILDGGTGLRLLGDHLMRTGQPLRSFLFFSHVHWDHIQGFPFFTPLFVKGNELTVYGGRNLRVTLEETLAGQMNFPNFPVTLEACAAIIRYNQFDDGQLLTIGTDVTIRGLPLQHPNGCYGYRIEHDNKVFTYCTDTEHGGDPDQPDSNVLELAAGSDLFVYDAQYTPDEYTGKTGGPPRLGWGHSTYVEAAKLARLADVRKLILFHHDPSHDDKRVEEIETECKALFPNTEAAREGRVFHL
jgi:phosphoribosyl 1,2-cyclic phosphodiesterase